MASAYRLDELGWYQFDRLAVLVLEAEAGLSNLQWQGDADHGRLAISGDDVRVSGRRRALRGPVSVAVVWVRDGLGIRSRAIGLVEVIAAMPIDVDEALLVVTNLEATEARRALRQQAGAAFGQVVVLGAAEISASLDRHPSIRRAMPSVLGLVDLTGLIAPESAAASTLDTPRAQSLARVFWPTQAYERALDVLGRHRFVVLTGPPEMGKTAIAQMLGLALMTDGWEVHECTSPEQVFGVFDPHRAQVFVADDAFGSTEYRPDTGERWAAGLGRLLRMLDDRHWLIWTSRPAPLKAGLDRVQRERGSERFPQPGEVLVDASTLDLADKTLILFRHAKDHPSVDAVRGLLRFVSERVVEHPHFTPERIRRFVADRLDELTLPSAQDDHRPLIEAVEQELASPTEAMRLSFAALEAEHRALLIAMLDAPAGLVDERELAETVRRHHPGGLSRPPGALIDRLTDHFLRVTPLGIAGCTPAGVTW